MGRVRRYDISPYVESSGNKTVGVWLGPGWSAFDSVNPRVSIIARTSMIACSFRLSCVLTYVRYAISNLSEIVATYTVLHASSHYALRFLRTSPHCMLHIIHTLHAIHGACSITHAHTCRQVKDLFNTTIAPLVLVKVMAYTQQDEVHMINRI